MRFMLRDVLLILTAGMAEAFLVWTLWNFLKASRRRPARGGSWKITEGPKTRHSARPLQDVPAAAYAKPAANSETMKPRTTLTTAR